MALTSDGLVNRTDPITGESKLTSPSDIAGFIGEYQCLDDTAECNVHSVGRNSEGAATYNYAPNGALEDTFSKEARRLSQKNQIESALGDQRLRRRNLQEEGKVITNPVMCIKQYDAVLFSITDGRYPVYLKDAILNSNQDFDYGKFLQAGKLAESKLSDGEELKVFSYVFEEQGVYVFGDSEIENVSDQKITIISVVLKDQKCST